MSEQVHVSFEQLRDVLRRLFAAHGCSDHVAGLIAENMAIAERDGALSHGIFRVDGYLSTLKSGWVDGRAEPVVTDVAPGFLRADARNGFTLAASHAARDLLTAKARENGVATLAIHNSQHFGALWPDVEPFAREGFVALSMVSSMACVVPYGGSEPVYGTNPLAFAAPRAGSDPVVFDQAASAMANGDVQIAAREGKPMPPRYRRRRARQPDDRPAGCARWWRALALRRTQGLLDRHDGRNHGRRSHRREVLL